MTDTDLFRARVALVQAYLRDQGLDGVLLSRHDNFAMATGGRRNFVYTASDLGANSLFVSKDGKVWFVGNTIEAPRLREEELAGFDCDYLEFRWFEDTAGAVAKREFGTNIASDDGSAGPNIHGQLALLRALLTELELEKYRRLGALAAEAMESTLAAIESGMPESEIAARLVAEGARRRCQVPVALVAADDRIARYRHPLPTVAPLANGGLEEQVVQRYVMVVGCFLREGLVVSLTRFRAVDNLPDGILDAYERICAVDARTQEATAPGRTLGDVFAACQQAYAEFGFGPNEWHNHHQGGATGYAGRTCKGAPGERFPVLDTRWADEAGAIFGSPLPLGQAYAWNPSAPGVKSEDTFILRPDGVREIVTETRGLPAIDLPALLGGSTEVRKSGISRS
ncbi:MAG: M24 family metallopeptidase [Candidatus Hydrogenedentes bacterium]|nr:M24 family metallopeptidase [Candidatus Hydrogenedentota bacterium]